MLKIGKATGGVHAHCRVHYYSQDSLRLYTMQYPAVHVTDRATCIIINNQHIVRLQGRSGQNKETHIIKVCHSNCIAFLFLIFWLEVSLFVLLNTPFMVGKAIDIH